jgi:hypothetical protein
MAWFAEEGSGAPPCLSASVVNGSGQVCAVNSALNTHHSTLPCKEAATPCGGAERGVWRGRVFSVECSVLSVQC